MGNVALPSYGKQLDVYHEQRVDEIIVLDEVGSPTKVTLIVWDDVADTDQRALIQVFGQYGSPVLSPGRQTVKFNTRQFVGSPHPTGLQEGAQYSITVNVTGPGSPNSITSQTTTIQGSNAQTFPQLASALSSALNDVDVAFVSGNSLRFSTTASGSNARVEIDRFGTLLNPASPLIGFNGFHMPRIGVSTAREVLELNRTSANVLFSDRYSFVVRGRRPAINQPQTDPLGGFRTEYFDSGTNSFGSPAVGVWRLLGTNALSGSPATVPTWMLP